MVEATDTTVGTSIIERSEKVPVVADLWAPWCGSCGALGPINMVASLGQVTRAGNNDLTPAACLS